MKSMEKSYEQLRNQIMDLLCSPDVENMDGVVSAYSLYEMVNNHFQELRKLRSREELCHLINKINLILSFRKKDNITDKFKSFIGRGLKCTDIVLLEKGKKRSEIKFFFSYGAIKAIQREVGSKQFYSLSRFKLDDNIVNLCRDDFNHIFDVLEDYYLLLKSDENPKYNMGEYSQIIDDYDSSIEIRLMYDSQGNVGYSIHPIDCDIEDIEWYGDSKSINTIIKENDEDILKKIPVCVDSLNPVCRQIVEGNMNTKKRVLS